jgi:hypothetical protein
MRKALRGKGFEGNVSFPAILGVWKTRGGHHDGCAELEETAARYTACGEMLFNCGF